MKAIELTLRNPYLVVVVVLATLVVGVRSTMEIPADLLPQFKTPAVQIVCFYPGMPPEVMERDIMSRLERWSGQSVGIEHQEAKAMLGVCVVKDFFREDIGFDTAMSQVTSYAMSDLFYLPPGTIPPMVMPFDPTASVPLCLVSVSSPTMTEKELYDVAYYELRNRLQSIQGVIAPAVYGGVLRRILAYVDPMKLAARGMSPMDVVNALQDQSVFIPTGNAKFGDIDYQIVSNAMTKTVEEMNEFPVKTEDGRVVFLRDIGEIKDSHQIQSNKVRINGRAMAYIPIYRQPGANTLDIVDEIKAKLGRIGTRLRQMEDGKAQDIVLGVVMDQSATVRASVEWLQLSAVLGAILAALVVLVFLRSLRLTFIVSLAIPLSILASLIGLFYTGDTINSMTLGGLALAIGILVDQSIVVLDNIVRHLRMGKSSMKAALEGTQEVALPVLVSTVTFVTVFFPVVFLKGIPKFLFQPMAIAVTFAVLASYVIAMLVIPSFSARLLSSSSRIATTESSDAGAPAWFTGWFGSLMSARFLVLLLAVAAIGVAAVPAMRMGTELFPPVDSNQFVVYVRAPSGTRIEHTERIVEGIEQTIMDVLGVPDSDPENEKHPESNLRILISNIGVLMDWPAAYTPNNGPMDAFVLVQTKGKRDRSGTFATVDELRKRLTAEFPTVDFAFDTGGMMTAAMNFGLPSPIQVQVRGSKLDKAQDIAGVIKGIVESVPGTTDVRIAQRIDYPQIGVNVDRIKAAQLGITQKDVIKNVVTALNSSIGFNPAFWIASNFNHYFIGAQYTEQSIESLDTLRDIPLTGTNSKVPVPLRNVASFFRTSGPAVVNHNNITRVTDVYANVATGFDAGGVATEIEKRLNATGALKAKARVDERGKEYDLLGANKGYSFKIKGETETMRSAFVQFARGLAIAALLVYLAMVAQLQSFVTPAIVMFSIPLGLIGVVIALTVTGSNLNIPAFMGIIMMTGIVVEYSIILLDFANRRVREGQSVRQAIQEATWIRMRPIMMTSLTTLLALVPMAWGAPGGEANAPLARTIIGGVLAATVLTLVVVPCLYVMVKREPKIITEPGT